MSVTNICHIPNIDPPAAVGVRISTEEQTFSPQSKVGALDRACAQIFVSWRKFVSDAEAQAQADEFRRRCAHLVEHFVLSDPELDQVLDVVAGAMSAQP